MTKPQTPNAPVVQPLAGEIAAATLTMGKAVGQLSRASGAVWKALQQAATVFPVNMDDAAKRALSGSLADSYKKHAALDNAAVIASQHARAIYLIATKAKTPAGETPDPASFTGLSKFFEQFQQPKDAPKTEHPGSSVTGATKPVIRAESGSDPVNPGPAAGDVPAVDQLLAQTMVSLHGLAPEVVQAVQDVVTVARANPQMQDAILMLRNDPTWFLRAAEAEVLRQRAAQPVLGAPTTPGSAESTAMALALSTAIRQGSKRARKVAA